MPNSLVGLTIRDQNRIWYAYWMSQLLVLVNAIRVVLARWRRFGVRSAAVSLRAFAHNAAVKVINRLAWRPRVECRCCGWRGASFRALDIGIEVLPGIECPRCRNHDRHRMLALYLRRENPFLRAATPLTLHCAPEPLVRGLLPSARWVGTDLCAEHLNRVTGPKAVGDGQRLPFRDNAFDGIVSIHVLEHVPSDTAAIHEYFRIIRPGGTAIVMVPMLTRIPETEDWGHPHPEMFGHYRTYSPHDAISRFRPFVAEVIHPHDFLGAAGCARHGIRESECVVLCRKPHTTP